VAGGDDENLELAKRQAADEIHLASVLGVSNGILRPCSTIGADKQPVLNADATSTGAIHMPRL
jgi:hypothetical protein